MEMEELIEILNAREEQKRVFEDDQEEMSLGDILSEDVKTWMESDGGRSKYFKGTASDCAARAMAIALNKDYKECYNELAEANKRLTGKKSARNGIWKESFEEVLLKYGWVWHPAPKFNGRRAKHFDMPFGRVIARMRRHYAAVIDGVIHDSWDSRERMIYGYWAKEN